MMFSIFCEIDKIVKKYSESYAFANNSDLNVILIASITEDGKENILNDLDFKLRNYIEFSHEYENGELKIKFIG